MRRIFQLVTALALVVATASTAFAQAQPEAQVPVPPAAPSQPAPPPPQQQEVAPPEVQWTQTYPTGRWVFTTEYGWIWVPNGAATVAVQEVPYTFLYTPAYGWTWYVSPWGWGPYSYGVWVRHPWHPAGWRGVWVAHPHVVTHLSGWHHAGFHGGHGHGGGHHR